MAEQNGTARGRTRNGTARRKTATPRQEPAESVTITPPRTPDEALRELGRGQIRFAMYAMHHGNEMDQDCAFVLNTIVCALSDREPQDEKVVRELRAVVDGAKNPKERFDRDLAMLVRCVRIAHTLGRAETEARMLVQLASGLTKLPVFQGLTEDAATAFVTPLLAAWRQGKRTAPTGVVADLVIAARDRSVALGHGSTLGRANTRDQVVKLVNRAVARYARTVATLSRGHIE
jgi:hypothetical protein